VRLWPVVLDDQPQFLRGRTCERSLVTAPLGAAPLIAHLRAVLQPITPLTVTIVSALDDEMYREQLKSAWPQARRVCRPEAFADLVAELDMSDALLMIDPRCLPASLKEIARLVNRHVEEPRVLHHLVAYDSGIGGTRERVSFDSGGRIRGIQRHYEPATWPFIADVAATVLPVASTVVGERLAPLGLGTLRLELARRGVPARDIAAEGAAFRLGQLSGWLAAMEHFVLEAADGLDGPLRAGDGHAIHPAARIVGPVVLHAGARVDANATIFGPAVVGAGAHVRSRAIVAHASIGAGCEVPADAVVQDTVWCGDSGEGVAAARDAAAPVPFSDWLSRLAVGKHRDRDERQASAGYLRVKRAVDVIAAAVGLAVLAPVMGLIALLIWLQRDGDLFYGDEREGFGGRVFKCWKFRTMSNGADAAQVQLRAAAQVDGPHFKMTRDPRVTRIGRFLRASNLDELPQLFNVLVGEMSLVGPRPSPFRENQICVPWRNARISVRPGITGMWQVCRHDRAAGDFHQWIEYDLLYVQHLSALVDFKILAATFLTLGGKATHVRPSTLIGEMQAAGESEAV